MAEYHDVWVLTRARNRPMIEAELRGKSPGRLTPVYIDLPECVLERTRQSQTVQIFYYLWQLRAFFVARRLHRAIGFDLVHHVTYAKFWAPSFVGLLGLPFVWGPVGGGESAPPGLKGRFNAKGRLYEWVREYARRLGERDPFVRLTARRSTVALATTEESAGRMRAIGARAVRVVPAIGLTQEDLDRLDAIETPERDGVRFLSIGRLLHWKGFDLGIEAFARAALPNAEYVIVGDGPERSRLEAQARKLGVADRVRFTGKISRDETLQLLGASDLLVHPSLHESGGLVCLEAMAARRPVLCLDWGGPAIVLGEAAGIRVAPHDIGQVVSDLAAGMRRLADDADLRAAMGRAGREQVEACYTWATKIQMYRSVYEEAIEAFHSISS
jgi:glycosyltransferase involved in cell wall biosynthesis